MTEEVRLVLNNNNNLSLGRSETADNLDNYEIAPSNAPDVVDGPQDSSHQRGFQQEKAIAQGMMDLALFSANANQLRYLLEPCGDHHYFYESLILLSISVMLQVAIGIGLIWATIYEAETEDKDHPTAKKIHNITTMAIFFVMVINVFISAFGVSSQSPTA